MACSNGVGNRNRFAFSSLAKIMAATSLRTGGCKCPPDTCIVMGSIPVFYTKIRERRLPLSYFGAGNRNRTGTRFTARDFKSLVSTYSTMPAGNAVILAHFSVPVKDIRGWFFSLLTVFFAEHR